MLFVPGIGRCDVTYVRHVLKTIRFLVENMSTQADCLIHAYINRDDFVQAEAYDEIVELERTCTLAYIPGGLYSDHPKTIHPLMFDHAGFDYLALLLDDVTIHTNYNLDVAVRIADTFNFHVSSPYIKIGWPRWAGPVREPPPGGAAAVDATFIEIFFTMFSRIGWRAYWEALDTIQLPQGWGSDNWVKPFVCRMDANGTLGVISNMTGAHGISEATEKNYRGCALKKYMQTRHLSPEDQQKLRGLEFDNFVGLKFRGEALALPLGNVSVAQAAAGELKPAGTWF